MSAAKAKCQPPASCRAARQLALTADQRKLIDEYVEVRDKLRAWKPDVNPHAGRFQELEAQILSWVENEPADTAFILAGQAHSIPVSMRENRRKITNIVGLFKKLGQKWVQANCKPTLGAIDKALTPKQRELYITEERTGNREIGEPARVRGDDPVR